MVIISSKIPIRKLSIKTNCHKRWNNIIIFIYVSIHTHILTCTHFHTLTYCSKSRKCSKKAVYILYIFILFTNCFREWKFYNKFGRTLNILVSIIRKTVYSNTTLCLSSSHMLAVYLKIGESDFGELWRFITWNNKPKIIRRSTIMLRWFYNNQVF